MTTIAQIQKAMGPVFMAWAIKPTSQDHHHTQPAFSSAWVNNANQDIKPTKPQGVILMQADMMMARLAKGCATGKEMCELLNCTPPRFGRVLVKLRGQVHHEQIGYGEGRTILYWIDGMEPPVSQRSKSFQLVHFFKVTPWASAADVPPELMSDKKLQDFLPMLVCRGLLKYRLRDGVKQYSMVTK